MTEIKSRLTIIGQPFKRSEHTRTMILAKCECGTTKEYMLGNVKRNHTISCGCYMIQRTKEANTTHGKTSHPLFYIWNLMKQRCYNEKNPQYKDYGGRGITICYEWKNSFETFFDWCINNGWEKGLEIDRRENSGNYAPENCRFVTDQINNQNKRSNVFNPVKVLTIRNLHKIGAFTKSELSRIYDVSESTVGRIIERKTWANI